jgi:hypothetical protein
MPRLFTGPYIPIGRFTSSTGFNIPIPFGCSFFNFLYHSSFVCDALPCSYSTNGMCTHADTFKRTDVFNFHARLRKCMHCDGLHTEFRQHYRTEQFGVVAKRKYHFVMNCLRPLKHWYRAFEFYLRHGCLSAFILSVLSCVCRQRPCDGLITRPRSPTDCVTGKRPRSNKGL